MSRESKSFAAEIDTLERRADDLLREHRERHGIPEVVYHYTRFYAGQCILKSLKIRFTNATYSLDSTEGFYADHTIASTLTNYPDSTSDFFIREMLRTGAMTDCYLSCFSSAPDLSSQWYDYGERGYGLAIGVVSRALMRRDYQRHLFYPVEYELQAQEELVLNLRRIFAPSIASAISNPQCLQAIISSLGCYVVIVRALLKKPTYLPEHERRFYNVLPRDPKLHEMPLEFFERGEHLVPYFLVDLADSVAPSFRFPIQEVWVGSCHDFAQAHEVLCNLPTFGSLAFVIKRSTVPVPCQGPAA